MGEPGYDFRSRRPAPALRGLVRSYTAYREWRLPAARRELPSRNVTLILSLEQPIDVAWPDGAPARVVSFATGLSDRPACTRHDGDQEGVQVDLTPLGARRLLGVPMHELANRVITLADVIGERPARELVGRVGDLTDPEARFVALDAVFSARIADAAPPPADVERAWRLLLGGERDMRAIARALGCSDRHLLARFREHVGLPPSTVARIVRFEDAVERLRTEPGALLGDVALACGYYDQSHLNRDFRAFAGLSPGEYRATRFGSVQATAAVAA